MCSHLERNDVSSLLIYLYKINNQKMKRIIRDEDLDNVYTAKTLSKELNVSERQIHYYREHNQLESVNKGRARFIYPKQSVINFLVNKWGYEYEQ
jgi:hypothetical protein